MLKNDKNTSKINWFKIYFTCIFILYVKYILKVQYYETDKMVVKHHSNYIRWIGFNLQFA